MYKSGPAPKIVHGNGHFPQPDLVVTKIEDDFMKKSQDINVAFNKLAVTPAFPPRPAHGGTGQAVTLWANFFDVKAAPGLAYFRYSIEVTPIAKAPSPSKTRTKRILALLIEDEQDLHGVYTDSRSNLYSLEKLAKMPREITISWRGQGEDAPQETPAKYKIDIKETGTTLISDYLKHLKQAVANSPQFTQRDDVLQTLNIVLGHYPHQRLDIAAIGQNKHYPIDPPVSRNLTGGLHAIRGIFTSVRPGTNRLLLNVNASHTICHADQPLADLIKDTDLGRDLIRLARRLRLVRVQRLHLPGRKNKAGKLIPYNSVIADVARTTDGKNKEHPPQIRCDGAGPKDVRFYLDEPVIQPATKGLSGKTTGKSTGKSTGKTVGVGGRYISVWDYFTQKFPNIKMNPDNPVVNTGDKSRPTYLPVEACKVLPGQPVATKLNAKQTREMILFACRKPAENADSIVEGGKTVLGLDPLRNPALGDKELTINPSLITVQARVLQAPQIQYSDKKTLHPSKGSWNMAAGTRFYKPARIGNWTYVALREPSSPRPTEDAKQDLRRIVFAFADAMRKVGMIVPEPGRGESVEIRPDGKDPLQLCLKSLAQAGAQFVLVILPSTDATVYGRLKSMTDRYAGFHTVCVLREKFTNPKGQDQYFANVAMKFNLKAGGINQALDPSKLLLIKDGSTMVVGIDVTHPSPLSQGNAPSVAGIVASIDAQLGQWPSTTRVQTGRTEIVADLEGMFRSRLLLWYKHNKKYPRNILVYRDGVSEGQYQLVLDQEIPQLRAACQKLYGPKDQPAISFIIVGKRHHVRFYPTSTETCDDKSNCKNGTVVDRGVTEVRFWDFYLQAHACLQGTARSAHYYVILDEMFRQRAKGTGGNPASVLEDLTHNLCHLFGRATKAVSVCPPAYYADLVCERSRHYLSNYFDPSTPPDVPAPSERGTPKDGKGKAKDDKGNDEISPPDDKMRAAIVIDPKLADTMYYI